MVKILLQDETGHREQKGLSRGNIVNVLTRLPGRSERRACWDRVAHIIIRRTNRGKEGPQTLQSLPFTREMVHVAAVPDMWTI